MTAVQADLFGHAPAPATKPDGLDYRPDVLTADEQAELASQLQSLSFKPYEHLGYLDFRRIAAFGRRYDVERGRLDVADLWPDFLEDLLARLAERVGLKRGDFAHALINEYAPGAALKVIINA